jgi:hypothetical protein
MEYQDLRQSYELEKEGWNLWIIDLSMITDFVQPYG